MEDIYIICFDFFRSREKYNSSDEFSDEYAVEFMGECSILTEKIAQSFPNKAIELSHNVFLLKSKLSAAELKEFLNEIMADRIPPRDEAHILRQIYVAEVNDLKFHSFRKKEQEIGYLLGL